MKHVKVISCLLCYRYVIKDMKDFKKEKNPSQLKLWLINFLSFRCRFVQIIFAIEGDFRQKIHFSFF